jgi:hypothetical protein
MNGSKIFHASEAPRGPAAVVIDVPPGLDTLHDLNLTRRDTVFRLLPGVHRLSRPWNIAAAAANISVVGEAATISGGVPVNHWTMVPDQDQSAIVYSQPYMDAETSLQSVTGKTVLWQAALPQRFNAQELGNRIQAWRGATRLILARSPTLTYIHATPDNITFKGTDIRANYEDFDSVHLVLFESWTASLHLLKKVDARRRIAFLASKYNAKWANQAAGSRYYVQNAIELLDAAGEFYIDRKRSRILLRMSPGDDPNRGDPVTLATTQELLHVEGTAAVPVEGLSFRNLTFAHTSVESEAITEGASMQSAHFLKAAAIHIRRAQRISFDACTIHATGGYALWAEDDTRAVQVLGSYAFDLGAGGIRLGSAAASVSEGHRVVDSRLSDGGKVWQEGCGVLAQKVQNVTIAHNEIAHFRYTGISIGWTWGYGGPTATRDVLTSHNHIHDIGLGYLSDMGCVYTLGHQPGSRVTHNYCSDVQSFNYGGWAYYTDEGSRDETFDSNVAVRSKCAGHHQHYGTDNRLTNNVYYAVNIGDVPVPGRPDVRMKGYCDSAVRASTHFRDTATCSPDTAPREGCCCYPGCDMGKCSSFTFDHNIVFLPASSNSTFIGATFGHGLDNFTFFNNTYYSAARKSVRAALFDFFPCQNSAHGRHNVSAFAAWRLKGKDADSGVEDPLFSSFEPTFKLPSSSPALARGFAPIDTSSIGPRIPAVGAAAGRAPALNSRRTLTGPGESPFRVSPEPMLVRLGLLV